MSEGIQRADLADGAVNYEKMSGGQRKFNWTTGHLTAPATGVTTKHGLAIPTEDAVITKVRAVLLVDGAGAGNTVTIDLLDDGTSILTTKPTFATSDAIDTLNDEAIIDSTKEEMAKDSVIQVSLTSAGTVTAGHEVDVFVEGYIKA